MVTGQEVKEFVENGLLGGGSIELVDIGGKWMFLPFLGEGKIK